MSDQPNRMQDRLADMAEATRLTVAGRLQDAAALLQHGRPPAPAEAAPAANPRTIDLVAERIGEGPAPERAAPQARPAATPAGEGGLSAILPERLRKVAEGVTRGLGPVLEGLGAAGLKTGLGAGLGKTGLADPAARRAAVPGAGRFIEGHFANAAGARDYKLFIPSTARPNAALVVMLHGCSQSPDDFAAGTGMNALAEQEGFFVVYPAQNSRANGQRCWNWFQPGDQGRESGETGLIAGLTRAVVAEHGLDARKVYIAGLSAGGAAAANIARAYPDLYAAVGIHSGLAAGCARDVSTALSVMRLGPLAATDCEPGEIRIPTIVVHGESDSTVNPRNGEQALAQAGIDGLRPTAEQAVSPGGLSYTRTRYADGAGRVIVESLMVRGLGHAWSGGSQAGSYTDPRGPDASRALYDFFRQNALAAGRA